jgi:hypothetical protein
MGIIGLRGMLRQRIPSAALMLTKGVVYIEGVDSLLCTQCQAVYADLYSESESALVL